MKEIQQNKWIWYGNALHFICGNKCQFHLATKVGKHVISTVGELWLERGSREIHAEVHDIKWLQENKHLLGNNFDYAYKKRFGFEEIGCDRKFETLVFKIAKDYECGCPKIEPSELDSDMYNSHEEANKGHLKMCKKWAKESRP